MTGSSQNSWFRGRACRYGPAVQTESMHNPSRTATRQADRRHWGWVWYASFYDVSRTAVRDPGGRSQIGGPVMAREVRKAGMKEVPLSDVKDDLSRYLREAETQQI